MSNDIISEGGKVVGSWDGQDVSALKEELARIKAALKSEGTQDKVTKFGVPHGDQFPDDLKDFTAYILWGCDTKGNCLVGSGANRVESVDSIREFYANDVAKDAIARHT